MPDFDTLITDCTVFGGGECVPAVFVGLDSNDDSTADKLKSLLKERIGSSGYFIVCYKIKNWFADFSPWEYRMSEKDYFAGNGEKTLWCLENYIVPYVIKNFHCDKNKLMLCGYSLAGLFSLWGLYKSRTFCGAASCSGSLWFHGWQDFVKENTLPENSICYLSLGNKEEKTSHTIMSTVGDITRQQDVLFENDENVLAHTLVINNGGHFRETAERTACGIEWLLKNKM